MSTTYPQEDTAIGEGVASVTALKAQIDKPSLASQLRALSSATTVSKLQSCCESTINSWGADYFSYRSYAPFSESTTEISNLDDRWLRLYESNHYYKIDPGLDHCLRNNTAIRWSELKYRRGKRGKLETTFMREARRHGLVDGVSIPVHGVGIENATLNISARTCLPQLSDIDIQLMSVFARHLHEQVRRVQRAADPDSVRAIELTKREIECMQWTAAGKTSWEISQIIGRSETTVVFHISNVIRKLGATNRAEAVAKFVSRGYTTYL